MEDKILGFQFVLVSAKPTQPSYNDGSDQDEPCLFLGIAVRKFS